MKNTEYQFKTEENEIRNNLVKAGYPAEDIDYRINMLKNHDLDKKTLRNSIIREIAVVMKGRVCAIRKYRVNEILSRVTGLSPNYINTIANYIDPTKILKDRSKNLK